MSRAGTGQQTDKQFFTLAAYKLHALCVKKNFPVQPLPLIILPFGCEESFSAGSGLSTCESISICEPYIAHYANLTKNGVT